ncbi:hypothetical protein T484DRAFT_1807296, partial [Baffinella frigidus]
ALFSFGSTTRLSGNSEFSENSVASGEGEEERGGGAASLWTGSSLTVSGRALFSGNTALIGGAVHLAFAFLVVD